MFGYLISILSTCRVEFIALTVTLPETNIAPENGWLKNESPFLEGLFSGAMLVSGRVLWSVHDLCGPRICKNLGLRGFKWKSSTMIHLVYGAIHQGNHLGWWKNIPIKHHPKKRQKDLNLLQMVMDTRTPTSLPSTQNFLLRCHRWSYRSRQTTWYGWWLTGWYGKYPIIDRVLYSTSRVVQDIFHQQYVWTHNQKNTEVCTHPRLPKLSWIKKVAPKQ